MRKLTPLARWGLLMFICCQRASLAAWDPNWDKKVALLQQTESEEPRCFAEGMRDLTCFWEESDGGGGTPHRYRFTYRYESEENNECVVESQPGEGSKTRYFCKLPKVQHFGSLEIRVYQGETLLYNRSLFINLVFLLDPPANLMVRTGKPGQLRLSWQPPPLKYMDDSMIYEVSYTTAGNRMEKVVQAKTEFTLRGLHPGTEYEIQVRVKPDGLTYDGHWSAWTLPVSMTTPPDDADPLILSLSIIISFILVLLSLTLFLSYRRFLMEKMFPLIPSPENKFLGLFTLYGGDFQEWLGHSSGGLWQRPALFYIEELPAKLEVLSEVTLEPPVHIQPVDSRTSSLQKEALQENEEGAKNVDSGLKKDWELNPQENWLMDQFRLLHQGSSPPSQFSLLEFKDAYVTLNQNFHHHPGEGQKDDVSEESLPLQVLFGSTETSTSHSDLGSFPQSSGSGRLSSQSSFEYPHNTWPPKGLVYACLTMGDSGISMDYSPMSSSKIGMEHIYSDYKNQIRKERQSLAGPPTHAGSWLQEESNSSLT
ncbi:erythropoietin receptor [Arapaima gigas]